MNTSAKGRTREHKTMKLMRDQGFSCIRAAASKGEGGIDIIFWMNGLVRGSFGVWGVAQIKSAPKRSKVSTLEKQAKKLCKEIIKGGKFPDGTIVQVWIWRDRFEPVIETVEV